MHYHEFVGQVQRRSNMDSTGDAIRAIYATLQTFGELIYDGNEVDHIAAQLPHEIATYIKIADKHVEYSSEKFFKQVSKRANIGLPLAVQHARAVLSVTQDALLSGDMEEIKKQLPEDINTLFETSSEVKIYP